MPRPGASHVLGILIFGAISSSAEAGDLAAFREANAALRAALESGAPVPGPDRAAHARLVGQAFDTNVASALGARDLSVTMNVCAEAVRTQIAFTLYGLAKTDASGPPEQAAVKALRRQNENFLAFQDELTAYVRFAAVCSAVQLAQAETFVVALKPEDWNAVRREGLQQMQRGLAHMISGAALVQLDPLRPENREAILSAVADRSDVLASGLSPVRRREVEATISRVLASPALPADAAPRLETIRRALAEAPCREICRRG